MDDPKKHSAAITVRVDCPDLSVRYLTGITNTVSIDHASGLDVRMSLTSERVVTNELRPTWNREPVGKPTGKRVRCEDLGAWSTRGVAGIQLIRVDEEFDRPLERGTYRFRSHHYFSRALGMYDFHPDDAPDVRVSMMYSEGDSGSVVDQYHKAVRLRVREQTGRRSFRMRTFEPAERIVRPSTADLMANYRCSVGDILKEWDLTAVSRHGGCPDGHLRPDWSSVSGRGTLDVEPKELYGRLREYGTPVHNVYKFDALTARQFYRTTWESLYDQFKSVLATEVAMKMYVPDYVIWGADKSEVASNLLKIYRPLRVVPIFHEERLAHKGLGDMSMKCTVAIVGSQYHPGADKSLRDLQARYGTKPLRYPGDNRAKLELVREPENKHDPNAVAIKFLGQMIGYVPRQDAKVVAKVMDAGVKVAAKYNGSNTASLYWPASTKEGVDAAYRIAMAEGEGL